MTEATLAGYRDLLQAKLAEVQRTRQGLDGITVVRSADDIEEAQFKLDRDLAVVGLNRESSVERGLVMGLRRIRQGTFGACTNCGCAIGQRRLDAVPWAPLCIDCQTAGEAGSLEVTGTFFLDAA
jgi:RNA polymerase-binding transcription factor DksA